MKRNLSAHRNPIRGVSRRQFGIELLLRQGARKRMTDPTTALQSFQRLLLTGTIQLDPGRLDKNLYSYVDEMDGTTSDNFPCASLVSIRFGNCIPDSKA